MTHIKAKITTLFFLLIILFHSCTPYKKSKDTSTIDNVQGYRLVKNKKENIYILYGWDYWFHPLKKKITLNWNPDFIKSIGWDKHSKELLFAGHTIIEPYYSTIGLIYRKAKSAEIAKSVATRMRKERKAENVFITKDTLGIYFYTVLTYQLKNKDLDVAVTYREYYSDAPLQFPCWGERKKR
ncbi:MAG TPA: hypothetical protein PLL00_10390 [Bacteroidia bacterium]|nr:hypothetical protein [Bacteroidia bacterium]